jgi:hypothetical protein
MWRVDVFCGGWNFSKLVSVDPTFIGERRVVDVSKFKEYLYSMAFSQKKA